ncbi:MAG TPA: hypothetical protein DCE56_17720 [Cyanobacteria bacterium UBA8553]|nr:hypothetical protein [Cyanobacteria bacterium UBA8553]HAJ62031.1 hypothetical protein [Cyanobacteria bacterium UBA8543]
MSVEAKVCYLTSLMNENFTVGLRSQNHEFRILWECMKLPPATTFVCFVAKFIKNAAAIISF